MESDNINSNNNNGSLLTKVSEEESKLGKPEIRILNLYFYI
jgi:hypothetical protein